MKTQARLPPSGSLKILFVTTLPSRSPSWPCPVVSAEEARRPAFALVAPAAPLAAVAAPAALSYDGPRADDYRARRAEQVAAPAGDRARPALVGDAPYRLEVFAGAVPVRD